MTVISTYATFRSWAAATMANVLGAAAAPGTGAVRLRLSSTLGLSTGTKILVAGVVGTTEANGPRVLRWVDATHVDLQGTTYSHAYVSGGKVFLLASDGMPAWPGPQLADGSVSNAGTSKLRAAGFSSSWTVTTAGGHVWSPGQVGPIGPLVAGTVPALDALFPLTITIDGGANDGGVDSYAFYLTQCGDPVRLPSVDHPTDIQISNQPQLFTVSHPGDRRHSGTVVIATNPFEVEKLFPLSVGIAPTDAGSLTTLLGSCHLYVSRLSDASFQWAQFIEP